VWGSKVLLVEDNEINQLVAHDMLKKMGLRVQVANNGAEAVTMAVDEAFDLIFMDIHMPVMDGLEATQKIREHDHLKQVPIIALTAAAMELDREKSLRAGMNDFLSKPFLVEKVVSKLLKWLDVRDNTHMLAEAVTAKGSSDDYDLSKGPEGFDLKRSLYNSFGGDHEAYEKALRLFLRNGKNERDEIRSLIESERFEEAADLVHKVKGGAGAVGASELYESAAAFDGRLRDKGEAADAEAFFMLFGRTLATIESYLQTEHSENTNAATPTPREVEAARTLIDDMCGHLREWNPVEPDQMKRFEEEVKPFLRPGLYAETVASIEQFRYERSIELLEEIVKVIGEKRS
ncbi:MAG: response regulator, partial [Sulfurimonadaceae bacterium]|nr:response regulator [Sulfurimonadaceae bacterium]